MARPDDLSPDDHGGDDGDGEALRWAGDEERGRDAPRLGGDEPVGDAIVAEAAKTTAPGSRGRAGVTAAFVVPYLAFAVGWIIAVQGLSSGSGSLPSEVLWQFGEFLTILAAPLWFAAVLTLTHDRRPLARAGWLALGLGVLVPWPFVLDLYAALQVAGSLS